MIDIIALIFLCKKMGNLAKQKGLKPGTWKRYTIMSWFATEIVGVMIGMSFYGQADVIKDNILGVMLLGLISAVGGYLFIKNALEKKPDAYDEEISNIGVDDLQPPRK